MEGRQALILSIDTATPCSSVAITSGTGVKGQILACLSLGGNVTHSRRLLSAVSWLMDEAGVDWQDIAGIGVSLGPGSFTGLRIGMATAKGLAAAAGVKLFGVSTLDSLAARCTTTKLICPVLDARKKEVYTAFYRQGEDGLVKREGEIVAISPSRLAESMREPVLMVGDGATLYSEVFRDKPDGLVSFAPAQLNEPSASSLGLLAGEMEQSGKSLDLSEAVPLYVRSSDAELNLLKHNKQKLDK